MDFPSVDIFQDEGQCVRSSSETLMVQQREDYAVKSCPPHTVPEDLGKPLFMSSTLSRCDDISVSSSNISMKFAGDLCYSQKNYRQAIQHYQDYLRYLSLASPGELIPFHQELQLGRWRGGEGRAGEPHQELPRSRRLSHGPVDLLPPGEGRTPTERAAPEAGGRSGQGPQN